ncbi:MAG: hypothetical protein NXI24_03115 [bacterium]|nr:hypothetical protein [bacterium]
MNEQRKMTPQTGNAANATDRMAPAVELPADLAADRLAHVVDSVRAEAQVAPTAYLADAIVPKGGE